MQGVEGIQKRVLRMGKSPESARTIENEALTEQIKAIHKKKRRTYGVRKMTAEIRRNGKTVNHKRVERIMKQEGIRSKVARKLIHSGQECNTLGLFLLPSACAVLRCFGFLSDALFQPLPVASNLHDGDQRLSWPSAQIEANCQS